MNKLCGSTARSFSIALLFALSCSPYPFEAPAKDKNLIIARGRVGEIKVGMRPDDIYAICGKQFTRIVDLQLEGMYSPAIELFKTESKKNNPEVIFELNQDKVYRIKVRSPQYKTDKGIGVGSTFGDLRRVYGIKDPKQIAWGAEGFFGVVIKELGMSFRLDVYNTMTAAQINRIYKSPDPKWIPDHTTIDRILVY
jgi:hypothetical protein